MAGFLEFMLQVKNIVMAFRNSGEPGVSQLPEKVEAVYTPFVDSVSQMDSTYKLSRTSEYTQQIADEDTRRDSLYLALKNQVQMFMRFTFDAEKQEAATYLWNIMKKYLTTGWSNYALSQGTVSTGCSLRPLSARTVYLRCIYPPLSASIVYTGCSYPPLSARMVYPGCG